MKKILLLFNCVLSLIISNKTFSQYHWEWARGASTTSIVPTAEGMQVAIDSSENVYVGGFYGYNISFGTDSLNGGVSCFLVKYDSSGNVQWAKGDSIAGTSFDESGTYGVCTDANGNCYVTGGFNDTVYFGSVMMIANPNNGSTFLVKYDPNGNVLWAKTSLDTAWGDNGLSVTTDHHGNVYVTGTFRFALSFDTCSITATGFGNVFLAKFDSSGNTIWLRGSESNSNNHVGTAVATDLNDNVYITGFFDSTTTFGTITIINSNPGSSNAFIVKYDSTGNVIWAQEQGSPGNDGGWSVACDLSGDIYQAGRFFIDSSFITKYNTAGNIIWTKHITGNPGGQIGCYEVTTDNQGNVYATGGFWSTSVNISNDTIINQPPGASDPMFIVKYNSAGDFLFAEALTNGGDDVCGIAVAQSGNIYIGGDYTSNNFILGNDTLTEANGGEEVFAAKLICEFNADFIADNSVCPGSCIDFINLSTGALAYQWYFPGATPDSSNATLPTNICYLNSGTYDVELIATNVNGSDTLLLNNYITVFPSPPAQGITQIGDTLFANAGSAFYQWYFNTNIISGATNYFYIATQSGNYSVVATDANGCEAEAVINNVIANTPLAIGYLPFTVYPNPVIKTLDIRGLENNSADEINIFNVFGEKVFEAVHCQLPIANCQFSSGIYFIEINSDKRIFRTKFLKQ